MKFLAMHITNQKLSFDIFTVKFTNIFMEHDLNILMIFGIKVKIYNFEPFNVFLAISTNIPQRLMTAFVLQGHVYMYITTQMYRKRFLPKWVFLSGSCVYVQLVHFNAMEIK